MLWKNLYLYQQLCFVAGFKLGNFFDFILGVLDHPTFVLTG